MSLSSSWRRLRTAGYQTALYRATLRGPVPNRLRCDLPDPWTGDPEEADALFQGRYRFGSAEARAPNQPPWRLRPLDADWTRELHGFSWLRHFAAAGGDTAASHARRLVRSWIELCGDFEPQSWAPQVLGRRIISWLSHSGFLLQEAEAAFTEAFLESLAMQWRHLLRVAEDAGPGLPRLDTALAAVYGALALPGEQPRLARLLPALEVVLARQVHKDGSHLTRCPSDQLRALRDLIALRGALHTAGQEQPQWLGDTIMRLGRTLRAFRHGDGGLALFNGSFEESPAQVEETLAQLGGHDTGAMPAGGDGGFQRLAAAHALLLFDAGVPPAGQVGRTAHAGTGSFEFSLGRHRMVVNCGSGRGRGPDWEQAMWHTAAHSAAGVADADTAHRRTDGSFDRLPHKLRCRRHEDESGALWLDFQHDGYGQDLGVAHRRRIYLGEDGTDLRGEDVLRPRNGAAPQPFAVRFHLHPDVHASPVQGGRAVLLKLNDAPGWRFRASGGEISVEESVYLGRRGAMRRTEQIVVRGALEPDGSIVKWAFRQA